MKSASTTSEHTTPARRRAVRRLGAAALITTALAGGGLFAGSGSANAVTTECADGRCVIRLSKAETRELGEGRAPKLPPGLPWQLNVSYFALTKGHQLIAKQYANRGWCSAFLLSPRPWDNQGYTGYRC
ncbi:hypothetical protein ACFYTF_14960 [Nocardia thailandica]|uniref:Secreted protein n=1 Tax=Nocardia thailandica TaxID=257275 RepID=A0ABW6PP15_9NOCA